MNRKCNRCGLRGEHMIWCPKRLACDTPASVKSAMTVDKALEYTDDASNIWGPKDASRVLAAEVRRLRAGVEKLGDKDRTFHIAYGNDRWVKVSDVLRIMEGDQ